MGVTPESRRPFKVLHLRQSSNIWGPEKSILDLSRRMTSHGIAAEIAIVYRRADGEPADHPLVALARDRGIPITQLDGRLSGLSAAIRSLRLKLQEEHFSVLHCHEYKTNLMGALATWGLSPRRPALVATVRHTEPGLQMRAFQGLDSLVLHRFDRLSVPSHGALQELKRWTALRRVAHVIHHSVEWAPDGSPASAAPWPEPSGPVVAIVGRLQAVKGHRLFLEAARHVLARRPDTRFWIVGEGELRGELATLTARLGLTDAVSFLGYRADVAEVMRRSDVVVSASQYEAFPRNLLEALALERPVVAMAVGGVPEIVIDGETGLLVHAREPLALGSAVMRLLGDPALARRLASAGRALVGERYAPEAHACRLAAFYREALGPAQPAPWHERPAGGA